MQPLSDSKDERCKVSGHKLVLIPCSKSCWDLPKPDPHVQAYHRVCLVCSCGDVVISGLVNPTKFVPCIGCTQEVCVEGSSCVAFLEQVTSLFDWADSFKG